MEVSSFGLCKFLLELVIITIVIMLLPLLEVSVSLYNSFNTDQPRIVLDCLMVNASRSLSTQLEKWCCLAKCMQIIHHVYDDSCFYPGYKCYEARASGTGRFSSVLVAHGCFLNVRVIIP